MSNRKKYCKQAQYTSRRQGVLHSTAKTYLVFLFLFLCMGNLKIFAQDTPFDRKVARYEWRVLQEDGCQFFHENIWAWLEAIKAGDMDPETDHVYDIDDTYKPLGDVIHNIIRGWGSMWYNDDEYAPYGAWKYAEWTSCTSLIWIMERYRNQIRSEDYDFVRNLFNGFIQDRNFSPGSENSRMHDMVGRYLYSQDYKDVEVIWSYDPPPSDNVAPFTWDGRTYTPGQAYKAYDLARDWLFHHMHHTVYRGHGELDSPSYTWSFIHGFISLFEFADDPEMRQRAKMCTDFLFLESVLDYTGNQWGSALGRTYLNAYQGVSRFYWDCFWDDVSRPSHEPLYNILYGSYRLPDIIHDIGDLSDEEDNYYHINMEYNPSIFYSPGTGKWNYVTKYYSLGGRLGSGWQLCVKTEDDGADRKVPFRLWVNTYGEGQDITNPVSYETYIYIGENAYQYKNAMFIRASKLHYIIGANAFDRTEIIDGWQFMKEGPTMIALYIREDPGDLGAAVLEVGIEGVDYQTFEEFMWAVLGNANLDYVFFTTSRGDVITFDQMPGLNDNGPIVKRVGETEFEQVWSFPFARIRTVDHFEREIVGWETDHRMVLTKHGSQAIYDFENWTIEYTAAPPDETPPGAPMGVNVNPKQQ